MRVCVCACVCVCVCADVRAWIQEVVLSPTASSYSMAQLTGSTEYSVKLQAIVGAHRSRHVTTVFTTCKREKSVHVHISFVFLNRLSFLYYASSLLYLCNICNYCLLYRLRLCINKHKIRL